MEKYKEILQQVGKNTEDIGRMLRRKKPFTLEDLTYIRDTLKTNAETIDIILNTSGVGNTL